MMENQSKRARHSRLALIIYVLVVVSILSFIWTNRFLPMQDYPDWLFQGYILSSSLKGEPLPDYEITGYAVPNIMSTLVIGLTNLAIPPEASGKVFLSLYVVILALGSAYFFRSAGAELGHPLCLVPLLLIASDPFFHGYMNYVLSIGVLLLGMGYIISRHTRREPVNPWLILAVSMAVYMSHAISYICLLVFIGLFALRSRGRSNAVRLTLGLTPSLVMLAIYTTNRVSGGVAVRLAVEGGFSPLRHLSYTASTGISQISIFHRFYPYFEADGGMMRGLAALNIVFCVAVIIICVYWLISCFRTRRATTLVLAALVYLILFIMSPGFFAGIFDPGQRFLYPGFWIILATLAARPRPRISPRGLRLAQLLVIALLVVQTVFLHGHARSISRKMEDVWQDLESARLGSDFEVIDESTFDYDGQFRQELHDLPLLRLPSHSVLNRLHYYLSIERRLHTRIFPTGLVSDVRANSALESVAALETLATYPANVVILGEPEGNRFIASLLGHAYELQSDHAYLIIMSRAN